jgi:hypothetical protein
MMAARWAVDVWIVVWIVLNSDGVFCALDARNGMLMKEFVLLMGIFD